MGIVLVWLAAAAILWPAGYLIATATRLRAADRVVAFAIHIALGLAFWPLLFLWTSTAGIVWSAWTMRIAAFGVLAAALIVVAVRARKRRWRLSPILLATFAVLVIGAIAVRLAHIRGLAFPPWVDGVHHGMIVRLLLEGGAVPATADPYIAGAPLYYHWGFHVPVAILAAMTGRLSAPDTPTLLLHYGQLLNALTLVTMYAGGRVLLRSREGGLFTAVLATFVSYYPAFYLSWGRYTHLAGTLLLPPLMIVLWTFARSSRPWRSGFVVALLAAGLVLVHARIALFAGAFAFVLLFANRRAWIRWPAAAVIAAVLIAPWLVRLAQEPYVASVVDGRQQQLSTDLLASKHNRELLAIATAGISGMAGWLSMPITGRILAAVWWVLLIVVSRAKPKSARKMPWAALAILAAWIALVAAGVRLTKLATIDSAVITMFMPLAAGGAALIVWALHRLVPPARATIVSCALALAIAVTGALLTAKVVNPVTVFAHEADLRAMHWIDANVPRDALFAVGSRAWMYPAWVGTDGGYWLSVATGRRSILPPLLYGWSLPPHEVARINTLLRAWRDQSALRAAGVTHVYLGVAADEQIHAAFTRSPGFRLLYRHGGAAVFEIVR